MAVYSCPPEITYITRQPRIDPVTPGGVFFHEEGQGQGVSQSLLQAVTRGREREKAMEHQRTPREGIPDRLQGLIRE